MESKHTVRQHLRAKLRNVPVEVRQDAAVRVWERLRLDPHFQKAKVIASFASLPTEIDTATIHHQGGKLGKTFVYPKVMAAAQALRFFAVANLDELQPSGAIREPNPTLHALASHIELFLVPGLGFTRQGGRLGRGKGYYDRTLSQSKYQEIPRYGLAFNEQILEELEMETHDVRVTKVFTPDAVF